MLRTRLLPKLWKARLLSSACVPLESRSPAVMSASPVRIGLHNARADSVGYAWSPSTLK